MPSIGKTKGGEVLVELDRKTTLKSTFCEGLLGEPMCSLEIGDLDCLTDKKSPKVTNTRIGITSVNFLGQKFTVVKHAKQYARKLLNHNWMSSMQVLGLTSA